MAYVTLFIPVIVLFQLMFTLGFSYILSVGFVYLLGDWGKEKIYKIGVTRGKIEKRIKSLQTGNSGEIYIVDYFETENPFFIEKRLHLIYNKERISKEKEWFELELEDVKKFKKHCEDIEKLIKTMKENHFCPKSIK